VFRFVIDVDEVDLREEAIQRRLFGCDAGDATVVVVADVHSLAFTRAATGLLRLWVVRWRIFSGHFRRLLSCSSRSSRRLIGRFD
jgi:hypothetical protein